MADWIIIGLLIILVIIAISSGAKHFRGEGGCCGGGSDVKIKKKKLKTVVKQRTVIVEGMTCNHCKSRIESRLNAIDGVSARVNRKKKTALVSMEREVSDQQIREVVENAGYQVVEVRPKN